MKRYSRSAKLLMFGYAGCSFFLLLCFAFPQAIGTPLIVEPQTPVTMSIDKINSLTPRILGTIGVDAGIIWIGDPCYILHTERLPASVGKSWDAFCAALGDEPYTSFRFDQGHEGVGVCTSTLWGDGSFPVIGFFDKKGRGAQRPRCVMIDFDGIFSYNR